MNTLTQKVVKGIKTPEGMLSIQNSWFVNDENLVLPIFENRTGKKGSYASFPIADYSKEVGFQYETSLVASYFNKKLEFYLAKDEHFMAGNVGQIHVWNPDTNKYELKIDYREDGKMPSHKNGTPYISIIYVKETSEYFRIRMLSTTSLAFLQEEELSRDGTKSKKRAVFHVSAVLDNAKEVYIAPMKKEDTFYLWKNTGHFVFKPDKGFIKNLFLNFSDGANKLDIPRLRYLLDAIPESVLEDMIIFLMEKVGKTISMEFTKRASAEDLSTLDRFRAILAIKHLPFMAYSKSTYENVNYITRPKLTAHLENKLKSQSNGAKMVLEAYPNISNKQARRWASSEISTKQNNWKGFILSLFSDVNDCGEWLSLANYDISINNRSSNSRTTFYKMRLVLEALYGKKRLARLVHNAMVNGKIPQSADGNDGCLLFDIITEAMTDSHMSQLKDIVRSVESIASIASIKDIRALGYQVTGETILEVHDGFSRAYLLLSDSKASSPIQYKKSEVRLAWNKEGYTFKLAEDKLELRRVGDVMNICVGSYGDSAIDKQLIIVNVMDESETPVVCIELDKKAKQVMQVKTKYNGNLQSGEELHTIVKEWIERNELTIKTFDFKMD